MAAAYFDNAMDIFDVADSLHEMDKNLDNQGLMMQHFVIYTAAFLVHACLARFTYEFHKKLKGESADLQEFVSSYPEIAKYMQIAAPVLCIVFLFSALMCVIILLAQLW